MFLCEPCTRGNGCWHPWPFADSHGRCEECSQVAECMDCHHEARKTARCPEWVHDERKETARECGKPLPCGVHEPKARCTVTDLDGFDCGGTLPCRLHRAEATAAGEEGA